MLPSTVLEYGLIPAQAFGIHPDKVDTEPNLVSRTLLDATRIMERARIRLPDPVPPESIHESALAKVTLSLLLRHYAANKTRFTGFQQSWDGRTETPLGTYDEMMRAASEYWRQAKELFPDADWPVMGNRVAGTIRFKRVL